MLHRVTQEHMVRPSGLRSQASWVEVAVEESKNSVRPGPGSSEDGLHCVVRVARKKAEIYA